MSSPLVSWARALPGKLDNALPTPPAFLYHMLGMEPPPSAATVQPWTPPQDGKAGATTISAAEPEPKPRRKPMARTSGQGE